MNSFEFNPADASHLADAPAALYCLEGQRFGDGQIVRRGELVHRSHPAVIKAPWAFGSEVPVDLSSAPDEIGNDEEMRRLTRERDHFRERRDALAEQRAVPDDDREVDELDDAVPFPEPELDVPDRDDDQAPDEQPIPYGPYPEFPELDQGPGIDGDVDPVHPDARD